MSQTPSSEGPERVTGTPLTAARRQAPGLRGDVRSSLRAFRWQEGRGRRIFAASAGLESAGRLLNRPAVSLAGYRTAHWRIS